MRREYRPRQNGYAGTSPGRLLSRFSRKSIPPFSGRRFRSQLKNIKIREKKKVLLVFMGYNITFIPVWILEYSLNYYFSSSLSPVSFINLYYFMLNLLNVIFFYKYFFSDKTQLTMETDPGSFSSQYGLTAREKEIVDLIARGYSNKMTASALKISVLTVRNHIYSIYQKQKRKAR